MISDNKLTQKLKLNQYRYTYIFVFGMLLLTVVLFNRCRYGFVNIDEALYLQIPYRLAQGDALIVDEWHISQLSSVIVYPLMSLFRLVKDTTEGIMLFFRIAYMIVQLAATVVIYLNLKKHSEIGAIITAFLFYIYVPFGIPTLSYNSMGIIFLSLALVMFTLSVNKAVNFIAGVFFAFAVLCCPYVAVIYILHLVVVAVRYIFKATFVSEEVTDVKKVLWYTAGIAATAIIFLMFVFSRATFGQFIESVPYVLGDPDHSMLFKDKVWQYFEVILTTNKYTFKMCCAYVLITLVAMIVKNKKVKNICFIAFACITAMHIYMCAVYNAYINHIMLPVNYLGLFCWVSYREKSVKKFFEGIFLPGVFYTVALHFSSNQDIYAISSAATVAMVGSIVIIVKTAQINFNQAKLPLKSLAVIALAVVFVIQGRYVLHYRLNAVFWEEDTRYNTVLLEEGPYKGIYVTESRSKEYYECINELSGIENSNRVLMLTERTWLYSFGDWKVGSFSTWIHGVNDRAFSRLDAFYEMNPDKMADIVFVEKVHADYIQRLEEAYGYKITSITTAGNYILEK